MTILKDGLHLLNLIEDQKYDDAVQFVRSSKKEETCPLRHVAKDLVYRVAHCFGNEDRVQLQSLLMELLGLFENLEEKFDVIYELLVWRTSPYLTKILLDQLRELLTTKFLENHYFRRQFLYELPVKLEKRLCERLASEDEELRLAVLEAGHVLEFFGSFPSGTPYKFQQMVESVLDRLGFDEQTAFPFLVWYSKDHPFSPRLLGVTEPTTLIPNIYEKSFLLSRLVEGIMEYLITNEIRSEASHEALENGLRLVFTLICDCQDLHPSQVGIYSELYYELLGAVTDMTDGDRRVAILRLSEEILSRIPASVRVLLLKNLMVIIVIEKPPHEHKLLCWILNRISDDLAKKEFKDELGTMLGLLEDISYDGEDDSREYLSSVVRITSTLVTNNFSIHQPRDNESMLTEIRERLIRRLHEQIVDCIQREHVSNSLDVKWLLSQPASALPEPILRLLTDLKTCKKLIKDINHELIREAHMRVLMEQVRCSLGKPLSNLNLGPL